MKLFVARILLFALFFVQFVAVYGQDDRTRFLDKLENAYNTLEDEPQKAIELGLEAFFIAKEAKDIWAMSMGRACMGYISYEVGDFPKAYTNYVEALETLKRADTTDWYNETIILNELSLIQSDFNNHDESIAYGQQALKTAKKYISKYPDHAKQNDQLGWLIDIPYYMAIEYLDKGAHQTAGKILVDLWDKAEDKKDILAYSQVLNELGIIKMKNAEFEKAREYFGLVVSSSGIPKEDKSIAYHNLAEAYMELGNYDKAESYYLIALDFKQDLAEARSLFVTYQGLGELESRRGEMDRAVAYWEKALETYDKIDADPELYDILNSLQLAYMDIDITKAKEFNRQYSQMNDFYVRNQREQREMEAQNRQALSDLIDSERNYRITAAKRQQFIKQFWPIILGVFLLIVFSTVLGIRYYKTVRANKKLTLAQLAAEKSEDQD